LINYNYGFESDIQSLVIKNKCSENKCQRHEINQNTVLIPHVKIFTIVIKFRKYGFNIVPPPLLIFLFKKT